MKYLEYKGYSGSIEYSEEDGLLYGQVLGIRGLISYEGETGKELEKDFKEANGLILIWLTVKPQEENPKNHLKAVLMFVFLQSFIKKQHCWQLRPKFH